MNIGALNERVTFYAQTKGAVNAYGEPTLTVGSGVERYAKVGHKAGGISHDGSGIEYPESYEFVVRAPLTVSKGDKAVWDGKTMQVVSVDAVNKYFITVRAVAI